MQLPHNLFFLQIAHSNEIVISRKIQFLLVVIYAFDLVAVLAILMQKLCLFRVQFVEADWLVLAAGHDCASIGGEAEGVLCLWRGYDVAVTLAEVWLEPVPLDQISAVLLDVVDYDKLVCIAHQHLPLLIDNQIFNDVVAGVDLVGCFLADGLVEYFLHLWIKYNLVGDAGAAASATREVQILSEYGYLNELGGTE